MMTDIDFKIHDFYDAHVVESYDDRKLDELSGYLIIFSRSQDRSLQVSVLLEGKAIDFLFGLGRYVPWSSSVKNRCLNIKSFIHSLPHEKQFAVVLLYGKIFKAVVTFHKTSNALGLLCRPCRTPYARREMAITMNDAFRELQNQMNQQ